MKNEQSDNEKKQPGVHAENIGGSSLREKRDSEQAGTKKGSTIRKEDSPEAGNMPGVHAENVEGSSEDNENPNFDEQR